MAADSSPPRETMSTLGHLPKKRGGDNLIAQSLQYPLNRLWRKSGDSVPACPASLLVSRLYLVSTPQTKVTFGDMFHMMSFVIQLLSLKLVVS